ncbi:MAG: aspartate-alanine antiporter [Muribaculaceae bacterium]|nr:aspartate-alanine antiporter [Muribaculaceae bacterium]
MEWLLETFRNNPSIPIFLTIGLGFWIGKLKYKTFSLGTVTSVLLVGVLVGQMNIPVPGPMKSVFFLLFLFAIGYSVGPQFFRALRGTGIKQVIFAVVMCVLCFGVTMGVALCFGYNAGEAAGLFAGSQTISAVIGVGDDTIRTLSASAADKQNWMDIVPVCYAVTYIFGTIGSAYILSYIGPAMLGGIKKVKAQTVELEKSMNDSSVTSDPAYINALRPVVFRAYKAESDFFDQPRTVEEVEQNIVKLGRRIYVDRIRQNGTVVDDPASDVKISKGDELVLSGRREYVIQDESWIGPEVADAELLSFSVEKIPVMVANKKLDGVTVDDLRRMPEMSGVVIARITAAGQSMPVLSKTKIYRGDLITIAGLQREVDNAAKAIGYADRPSKSTDLVFVGLGIFIGALIGAITIHLGGIPISLSTSGGALIAGLILGWLRSKHPTFGGIPDSSVWLMNNLGLNMFIAVIGITAAPSFIGGLKEVGWLLFVAGVICTTVPLIIGVWMGAKIFKFHPAINLGCCAGSRVTTASLGAIQDSLNSTVPALGYTITYAIGNTLLILMGVAITLVCAS